MAININENGTIKTISDNLHPGSVFLLDLSERPLRDLGITTAHYGRSSSNFADRYLYSTSFELGFAARVVILLSLIGATVQSKRDYLNHFYKYENAESLFKYHKMGIYFQQSAEWAESTYFIANATEPGKVVSDDYHYFIYTNFKLNGSKIDMYNFSEQDVSYFNPNNYFGIRYQYSSMSTAFTYNPYLLVIAV